MHRRLGYVLVCAAVGLLGCGDDDGPAVGSEGGACYPNGTCDDPLVCLSDLCVRLDGPVDAGVDATSGPSDGGADAVTSPSDGGADGSAEDCDVLEQSGCEPTQGCYAFSAMDDEGAVIRDDAGGIVLDTQCLEAGTNAIGDPCTGLTSCVAGAVCLAEAGLDRCLAYCDLTESGTNPGCMPYLGDIGVELPLCDPLEQDCEWSGWACSSGGMCFPEGTSGDGDACGPGEPNCAEGLGCIHEASEEFPVCRPFCSTLDGSSCDGFEVATCTAWEEFHGHHLSHLPADLGFCALASESQ